MRLRTTKTSSGSTAVQVVEYVKRKMIVLTHIGSAKNEEELNGLKESALQWIKRNDKQLSLFPLEQKKQNSSSLISLDKCDYLGFKYQILYNSLKNLINLFKFHLLPDSDILNDLVIARIASPGSKVHLLEFLDDFFSITHHRSRLYRYLPKYVQLKDEVEARVIRIAKRSFNFNFNIVFYDLTTLYFESFETDELRRIGFSKDNKGSNPQIMIGLIVNEQGFPVSYQVFPGNKFEGHTLMPSINAIRKKHKIKNMTVVADAAMISEQNVNFLIESKLDYIVGARMAGISIETIKEISKQLNQENDATIRINIKGRGELVCHFCDKRYNKDKRELEKQINKANEILKTPSKAEIIKRAKFLININNKNKKDKKFELNQPLIIKYRLLLGIKGYFTSHKTENNLEIVNKYKQLWNVERSFKISKSDLKARPIFHTKQQAIENHILICFMALAIAKYMEIKTQKSIKFVIKELKRINDARIYDRINKREVVMRSKISDEAGVILEKLGMSY
jgi:transposase